MMTQFLFAGSRRFMLVLCLIGGLTASLFAAEKQVESILALGPFSWGELGNWTESDQTDALKKTLVRKIGLPGLPAKGSTVTIFEKSYSWRTISPGQVPGLLKDPGMTILSLNMEVGRYLKGTLNTEWSSDIDLFVNGVRIKGTPEKDFSLELDTGSYHLILLVQRGEENAETLEIRWDSETQGVRFHTEPARLVSAEQLFHAPTIQDGSISPDGTKIFFTIRGYDEVTGHWFHRAEIRATGDGALLRQWNENPPSSLSWSWDNRYLAHGIGNNLWLEETKTGIAVRLLEKIEEMGPFFWSRDSRSIFFHWTKNAANEKKGVKRYRALEDRWAGWRDNTQIFQVDSETGLIRQLTHEDISVTLIDVSLDGDKILYQQSPIDYEKPPHTTTVLKELDLTTGETTELAEVPSFVDAAYGPDGIYVVAGPDEFENLGSVLDPGVPANNFDGQLYRLKNGKPEPLSRDFNPSIGNLSTVANGDVVLQAAEEDESPLYLYRSKTKKFERISSPASIIDGFAVATADDPVLVWWGTGPTLPQRAYAAKLGDEPRQISDPAPGAYVQTRFGEVKDWDYQKENGESIDGRYYTPPDFDPSKKYPLIVYYYGGTVTVDEAFTGRYPFNLWAANGYVIYVPQPSGTTGYGQEFSARHVNAWGRVTADDIIGAVKGFTEEHDFVDPKKIGCMGASYGGFMTMYLITRTNMFSAAISHAGISSLTGYWGKGWWGYLYNGVAGRDSFPWNNPELYVDQSPVYQADKVQTPLLLLTGDADTNVPPEQSHVMYTALKLLGKDVELITVDGENHWILEHDKRFVWWDTILAWFDKRLKNQPEWWNALYPK